MPPQFATLLTLAAILYLFRREHATKAAGVSRAIWLPYAWMFIAGSRFVSQWLNPDATLASAEAYLEGSPLDRAVFLVLIMLGVVVLIRRNLDWRALFRRNIWVLLFLLYGLTSILWSDYPYVAFKRWIKSLGTPVMALIILTERRPFEALGWLMRRLSYVLLPVSILYIKYYPELGRQYHMGRPMFTGVASQKNGLGQLCLVFGMYYCWDLLFGRDSMNRPIKWRRFTPHVVMLSILAWLLHMADSSTSLMSLIIAIGILVVSRVPSVSRAPGKIVRVMLVAGLVAVVVEVGFNISAQVIALLGRDPTLTTRVPMWYSLLAMAGNPWFGVGYESFWLGARLPVLLEMFGVKQAHNGYLETYLNIGLVGLILMVALMLSALVNVRNHMKTEYGFSVLRLTLVVVVAVYSWTEAVLYGVSNMWLLLIIASLDTKGVFVDANDTHPRRLRQSFAPETGMEPCSAK